MASIPPGNDPTRAAGNVSRVTGAGKLDADALISGGNFFGRTVGAVKGLLHIGSSSSRIEQANTAVAKRFYKAASKHYGHAIASKARSALDKVGSTRKITHDDLTRAISVADEQHQKISANDSANMDTFTLLADAARRGVNASKGVIATKVLGAGHSMDEVRSVLLSGDGGIRRGTTALTNIRNQLRPATRSADTLQGTVAQWNQQTGRIVGMAGQIADAEFNKDISGNFTQYGTSQNNPYVAVADHPQHDQGVREWLAEGVDLIDQLLVAQERAGSGQSPLAEADLNDLQSRVNDFANPSTRETGHFKSEMDIVDDVLREVNINPDASKRSDNT